VYSLATAFADGRRDVHEKLLDALATGAPAHASGVAQGVKALEWVQCWVEQLDESLKLRKALQRVIGRELHGWQLGTDDSSDLVLPHAALMRFKVSCAHLAAVHAQVGAMIEPGAAAERLTLRGCLQTCPCCLLLHAGRFHALPPAGAERRPGGGAGGPPGPGSRRSGRAASAGGHAVCVARRGAWAPALLVLGCRVLAQQVACPGASGSAGDSVDTHPPADPPLPLQSGLVPLHEAARWGAPRAAGVLCKLAAHLAQQPGHEELAGLVNAQDQVGAAGVGELCCPGWSKHRLHWVDTDGAWEPREPQTPSRLPPACRHS
jgi:hypothetical protein